MEGIIQGDFKIHHKATGSKTSQTSGKNKHIDQGDEMERLKTDPLIFDKDVKVI